MFDWLVTLNASTQGRSGGIWDWVQMGMGAVFFCLVLLGDRPPMSVLIFVFMMFTIIVLQHFVPRPAPADDELVKVPYVGQFPVFQGVFALSEALKFVLGLSAGARLMIRRGREHSQRD